MGVKVKTCAQSTLYKLSGTCTGTKDDQHPRVLLPPGQQRGQGLLKTLTIIKVLRVPIP